MQNKRQIGILLTIVFLLLVPLIAMQFTEEVKWTLSDFVVMSVLLFVTGFAFEFVMRMVKKTSHRITFCAIILLGFLLIWAELAVGIFGTPFGGS